jgi:hypothetical protein
MIEEICTDILCHITLLSSKYLGPEATATVWDENLIKIFKQLTGQKSKLAVDASYNTQTDSVSISGNKMVSSFDFWSSLLTIQNVCRVLLTGKFKHMKLNAQYSLFCKRLLQFNNDIICNSVLSGMRKHLQSRHILLKKDVYYKDKSFSVKEFADFLGYTAPKVPQKVKSNRDIRDSLNNDYELVLDDRAGGYKYLTECTPSSFVALYTNELPSKEIIEYYLAYRWVIICRGGHENGSRFIIPQDDVRRFVELYCEDVFYEPQTASVIYIGHTEPALPRYLRDFVQPIFVKGFDHLKVFRVHHRCVPFILYMDFTPKCVGKLHKRKEMNDRVLFL